MAEAAQVEYQKTQHRKVPFRILHFVLHSLSFDPPPPMPVVADCLSTIAIDLGCDVSNAGATTSDERCVHILRVTNEVQNRTPMRRPRGPSNRRYPNFVSAGRPELGYALPKLRVRIHCFRVLDYEGKRGSECEIVTFRRTHLSATTHSWPRGIVEASWRAGK